MKCGACNYEYEESVNDDTGKWETKGDEDFIQLDCNVTRRVDYADEKVTLYCCPKCQTIKATGKWGFW